jgi:monoamine oxidase
MGSVYPHTPVADMIAAIDAANAKSAKKQVTILGAGIAGLAAATLLQERGHRVTIIEGSERVGGRILTHRFSGSDEGLYGELGAMRIPASHDYTLWFIQKAGLATRPFVTAFDNDQAFLDMRGTVARIADGPSSILPLYSLTQWERELYPAGAIFGQQLSQLMSELTDDEVAGLFAGVINTPRLRAMDSMSLGDFFRLRMTGPDTPELVGAFTMLEGWKDMAVSMFLRDQMVDTSTGLREIVGGTGMLTDSLARGLSIQLRTEVTAMRVDAGGANGIVVAGPDGTPQSLQPGHVICTIPFPVLRRMDLSGFEPLRMRAINEMNYAEATKVLLRCSERFWETKYGIFGGGSLSDHISRSTYYPSDHADVEQHPPHTPRIRGVFGISAMLKRSSKHPAKPSGGPGVLLASYTLGQDAQRLGALDPADRVAAVIRSVARFHPELLEPGVVLDSATIAWGNNKWSGGAFAFLWPNQLETLYPAAIAPAPGGRLWFAGEHCSTDQAWIQGALISSLRGVLGVLQSENA